MKYLFFTISERKRFLQDILLYGKYFMVFITSFLFNFRKIYWFSDNWGVNKSSYILSKWEILSLLL